MTKRSTDDDQRNLAQDAACADAVRSLDALTRADPRSRSTLDAHHAEVATIVIDPQVPESIRHVLETAKNLSLYAYFVYRFHPVARLVAYSALEGALRERCRLEGMGKLSDEGKLVDLLSLALERKWITGGTFENVRHAAAHRMKISRANELNAQRPKGDVSPLPVTEADIQRELETSDFAKRWAVGVRELRNLHAHGELPVDFDSAGVVRMVCEAVNGLLGEGSARGGGE